MGEIATLASAWISNDTLFRYSLWRVWQDNKPTCVFIGLNPSTADAYRDDPTIRRCIGYAKSFECGSLLMLNLYAYRATDWKRLRGIANPVGEWDYNDIPSHINQVTHKGGPVIAAWGGNVDAVDGGERARNVAASISNLQCLKVSDKTGHPAHPLYLRKELTPIPFKYFNRVTPAATVKE